jgi:hypothetical protein
MPKFTVTVVAKDYWTVELEAEDEAGAEDLAWDICQGELLAVSEKERAPTLKYVDSEWDFYVDKKEND